MEKAGNAEKMAIVVVVHYSSTIRSILKQSSMQALTGNPPPPHLCIMAMYTMLNNQAFSRASVEHHNIALAYACIYTKICV